jgi:hypothetical protein
MTGDHKMLVRIALLSLVICSVVRAETTAPVKVEPQSPNGASPAAIVQRQLDAYNARNIDAFAELFSEDVEVYDFPNKLSLKGRAALKEQYGMVFERAPKLHCDLLNQIVQGNTVIYQERCTGFPKVIDAVAIYEVDNGKITRMTLIY